MKRFLMASALVFVLSWSAFAGDIPTDGSPSPTGANNKTARNEPEGIPTCGALDQLSSDALSALLSVLSFMV